MGRPFLVYVTICAMNNYWYNGFVNLPQVEIVIRTAAVDRDYIPHQRAPMYKVSWRSLAIESLPRASSFMPWNNPAKHASKKQGQNKTE